MTIKTVISEVNICHIEPDEWGVEAIDDDGGIEVAAFSGPRSRHRADIYAATLYPDIIPNDWEHVKGKNL